VLVRAICILAYVEEVDGSTRYPDRCSTIGRMDPGVMLRRLQPASSILTGFRPVLLPSSQVRIAFVRGVAARALEFAILIAARTGEVLGAHWSEIDFGAKLWTVPLAG